MASNYMRRKFEREFAEPVELWTGEDGSLMAIAIARTPDAADRVTSHWVFQNNLEKFKPELLKEKFAYRERKEDMEDWSDVRVLWRVDDDPTDFPVFEYEFENCY